MQAKSKNSSVTVMMCRKPHKCNKDNDQPYYQHSESSVSGNMSGRGGRGHNHGGHGGGSGRGSGCGHGRGNSYLGHHASNNKGLCSALGNNVFDYGLRGATDQMRNTWDKVCEYVGTEYRNDIANDLINKVEMTIPQSTYPQLVQTRHTT